MVKNKKFIMLILQLGLMGMFVIGTYHFTQKELTPTDVYVFTKKMNKNAELEASDFRKIQVPSKAVGKDFLTDKEFEEIKNGNMVITTNVEAGQYAYKSQIGSSNKVDPFEKLDLSKYRKVSIPVSYETAVSGEIKRGDKVDLAYISKIEDSGAGASKNGTYSTIFMQSVLVHSVTTKDGFEFVGHAQVKKSQLNDTSSDAEEISNSADYEESIAIVTLAVPITDVEEITARVSTGEIQIIGRFDESTDSDAPGYYIGTDGSNSIYAGNKNIENSNN